MSKPPVFYKKEHMSIRDHFVLEMYKSLMPAIMAITSVSKEEAETHVIDRADSLLKRLGYEVRP